MRAPEYYDCPKCDRSFIYRRSGRCPACEARIVLVRNRLGPELFSNESEDVWVCTDSFAPGGKYQMVPRRS